jgi:uncharacterized membrane protein required for colicin V production
LGIAGAARSGWRRGFVFYAIDLAGFVGAVVAAVRFHEVFATLYHSAGLSTRTSALLGGLTIFVPLIVAIAIVGGRVSRGVYKPGLFTTNRVAGAAFGAALGLCVVAVALMAVRSQPLPFGVERLVQRSPLGQQIVDWVAPAVRSVNTTLDLGLCQGKLSKRIPEVCAGR